MKKGQGAPKRKTLLETKFGPAAAGEAGKHLALLDEYSSAVSLLSMIEALLADNEPGVNEGHVEARRQQIRELKDRIFESWEKVRRQPETLRNLAIVAERNLASAQESKTYIEGAVYPVDWAILTMYRTGHPDYRNYQKLFAFAAEINPEITDSTFSRIVKRYKLDLKKATPGRRASVQKRT